MVDFKSRLISFVSKYKYTICFYIILLALSLIFRISVKGDNLFKDIFFALVNASVLLFALIIFARTFLRIPVVIILSLLMTIDVGLFYVYNSPMNHSVIASIFETNISEVRDVMKMVLPIGLLAFCTFIFLSVKSSVEIRKVLKINVLTIVIALLFSISVFYIIPVVFYKGEETMGDQGEDNIGVTIEFIKNSSFFSFYLEKINDKYPFVIRDVFLTGAYLDEMARIKEDLLKVKSLPQGIIFDSIAANNIDKIILVIGESANRENFSLYGYSVKTTPFLDSLSFSTDLLSYYDNIISPSCFTREALRLTLSYSTPLNLKPFTENKNLINLAKDAGFKTYWVSNQGRFGAYNSLMNILANNADSCFFNTKVDADDLDLIPHLRNMMGEKEKQFFIVHLQGSHWLYSSRYDDKDTKALGITGEYIDYDKSLHHTDRVLAQIYKESRAYDENVLLYYYSDHGEVINVGHGMLNEFRIQYRIPLVVMQNRSFINSDSIICKYYDEKSNLLSTSSNIYILGEFMGYKVADSLIQKSKVEGRYTYQADGTYCLYESIKN